MFPPPAKFSRRREKCDQGIQEVAVTESEDIHRARTIRNRAIGLEMMEESVLPPPVAFTRRRGRKEIKPFAGPKDHGHRHLFNRAMALQIQAEGVWNWTRDGNQHVEQAIASGE
eukprot:1038602-Rhodomonas_salina.1